MLSTRIAAQVTSWHSPPVLQLAILHTKTMDTHAVSTQWCKQQFILLACWQKWQTLHTWHFASLDLDLSPAESSLWSTFCLLNMTKTNNDRQQICYQGNLELVFELLFGCYNPRDNETYLYLCFPFTSASTSPSLTPEVHFRKWSKCVEQKSVFLFGYFDNGLYGRISNFALLSIVTCNTWTLREN